MSSTSVPNGLTNEKGQGASHATSSSVPGAVQDKAPKSVEHKVNITPQPLDQDCSNTIQLPDSVHDTGSNSETGKVSHATGKSIVPQVCQTQISNHSWIGMLTYQ
jgi:hypothetical protein